MIRVAACKVRFIKNNQEVVIPVIRHGNIYQIIKALELKREEVKIVEQGFLDDKGVFFDRKAALAEAQRCGQLPATVAWTKENQGEDELYSEDLY